MSTNHYIELYREVRKGNISAKLGGIALDLPNNEVNEDLGP